jgi:copper chaperone
MLKLKVPEMSCSHCVGTIEKAVKRIDPAARVTADFAAATIAVDSPADEGLIREAIKEAGYDNEKQAA